MDSYEYKMLQFNKSRNKLIYEVYMISDLVSGLKKFYDSIFSLYIQKCEFGKFDEDFNMLCEQLDVLYKDIYYYDWFCAALPNENYAVVKLWNAPPLTPQTK